MIKNNTIEVDGKALEVLKGGFFKVELPNKHTVIAHVSVKSEWITYAFYQVIR